MNKVSVTRKDEIINMNTEIRLASELVFQTEMLYRFMDRALFDKYMEGRLHEQLTLDQIIDLMGPSSFCNALASLNNAGMAFMDMLKAMDRAIRLKVAFMSEEDKAEEAQE